MKKTAILLCMLALALAACKPEPEPEPTPNNGGQNNDTTETVVKKYLVKELLNDDPEKIRLAIDWNDDCTQILHAKYGTGNGYTVDYDFKYFGNDSIRVIPSLPQFSYPIWSLYCDSAFIHLNNKKIDSIDCYAYGDIRFVERYYYDNQSRIIERTYFWAAKDTFTWEGANVVEACMYGNPQSYNQFTDYIHPYYNLPFYLSNFVSLEVPGAMFAPLWKYQPVHPRCIGYEIDEAGYLTQMTFNNYDSTQTYTYNYYYITPNQ